MNKERIERIGKFLNDRMIIHRNVENNTPWTTEEKMIQELYDNYLEQRIMINKAIEKLHCWGEVLDPEFQQEMLKILEGDNDEKRKDKND